MITNTGKQIIGRYLVGLTDTYASHLAIGCGAKSISATDAFDDYSSKTSLDFEMVKVPIISKNIINESGITKVILTAELPTTDRYAITEIGVYPSISNPTTIGLDSKSLLLFSSGENWQYHTTTTTSNVELKTSTITNSNNDITETSDAFFTTAENSLFENLNNLARISRREQPRFLSNVLLIRGDTSSLTVSGDDLSVSSGNHLHLETSNFGLNQNSSNDEIRLAFSVVNKDGIGSTKTPSNVKVLVQFASTDGASPQYASLVTNLNRDAVINTQTPTGTTNITLSTANNHNISVGDSVTVYGITPEDYNGNWIAQTGTTGSTLVLNIGSNPGAITTGGKVTSDKHHDFENDRYVVVSSKISSLYKTASFSWSDVNFVKVFVDIEDTIGGASASDFYIALDALRLENLSSFNNKYGLIAYTVVKTPNSLPIIKSDNSRTFIEFKYILDVL